MTDEKYVYTQDVRDKKITARSARSKRTHNGKGGGVRLPSDNMTQKELKAMNGPVKSFPLNSPMKWDEFMKMPDDIKIMYIKALKSKWNVPNGELAKMFGCVQSTVFRVFKPLGLTEGAEGRKKSRKWDKDGFLAWLHGVPLDKPANESEDQPEAETASREDVAPCEPVDVTEGEAIPVQGEKASVIPCCGSLSFDGAADAALKMVAGLLGGVNVRISIAWELCDNG